MTEPLPGTEDHVRTYRAARRLEIRPDEWREPGELLPEAHGWRQIDSWVHTGHVDEVTLPPEEVLAAIDQFIDEADRDRIAELAGLSQGVMLEGNRRTPRITEGVSTKRRGRKSQPATEATKSDTEAPAVSNNAETEMPALVDLRETEAEATP